MTEEEKRIIRECLKWFRRTYRLGPYPRKSRKIRFIETDYLPDLDDTVPDLRGMTRERVIRATAHSLLTSALIILLAFGLGRWFDTLTLVFTTIILAATIFFPLFLAVTRSRSSDVYLDRPPDQELIRVMALAYLNSNLVRDYLHALGDVFLCLVATSYQEGLSAWFERAYCQYKGLEFNSRDLTLRTRNGLRLIRFLAWIFRKNFPVFLLRYS